MNLSDIQKHVGKSLPQIAQDTGMTVNGIHSYFNENVQSGSTISSVWSRICEAYNLNVEIVVWPKNKDGCKWEALEREAKKMQGNR